jgi:hypothetical protein
VGNQLIIAGAHRSGTSATARLFQRAGLFLGDELDRPSASNPYGLFEDREMQQLHEGILQDNGTNWQVTRRLLPVVSPARWNQLRSLVRRREAEHELWGFKDPRACLFLELWKRLLPDAKCVVVFRRFADSTRSLERRAANELFTGVRNPAVHRRFWQEPDLAVRIWLAHNEALAAFCRRHPEDVIVGSFASLRDGLPIVRAVEDRWQLGLTDVAFADVFDERVTSGRSGRQPLSDLRLGERLDATLAELEALERETTAGWAGAGALGAG